MKDLIAQLDPGNQFSVLENSYKQIEVCLGSDLSNIKTDAESVTSVIITGLGGSAIAGDLVANLFRDEISVPYSVNRNYSLPGYAGASTLLIASSYSGNTEETISALTDGIKRGCRIICLTTGGTILEMAKTNNLSYVLLPTGFQPRFALYAGLTTLVRTLNHTGIIKSGETFLNSMLELIRVKSAIHNCDNSEAVKIAQKICNTIPVIYSADDYTYAVGERFKCNLNENSKMHAFHNVVPEMNHNEIIGWETVNGDTSNLSVINILEETYHPQTMKRFNIVSGLILDKGIKVLHILSDQKDVKMRLMDMVYLLDWVTYYAAILNAKDPSEIDFIHLLKKELGK